MRRRQFLGAAAFSALHAAPAGDFTFVHFTDVHIQPELRAANGAEMAFAAINAVKPDLCIAGGDLVFDVYEQGPARARLLFDLYAKTVKGLRSKVYSVPGNHDVFGVANQAGVPATDPLYGKKMFEDRIGPRYQSFDHKGWHFVLLDSIAIGSDRQWYGGFDEEQMEWLRADLGRTGPSTPIIVVTHIPLATAMGTAVFPPEAAPVLVVRKPQPILEILAKHNIRAVLQGHTHIREVVHYNNCQFITTGAVSGNWWKGEHHGHPEGFAVIQVKGGEVRWSYRTYGWKAAPPRI
jgi:3',5'-cyclic AMP phosphodiesterase CpdA